MEFNINNYEYDCTPKCCLPAHGNSVTSALTKRTIDDERLAAFIAKTCCNFYGIVDDLGRTAVHMAATVGRYKLLEWLLNQGAVIDRCDLESGSTALHRAIFYGSIDCAVLLIRYGANLNIYDNDSRIALQNVCRLSNFNPDINELRVWGLNKYYNLGVENDKATTNPRTFDFFRKEQISFKDVALGPFHCLFLDWKANLYAVGHGKGGRLGVGNESIVGTPKRVKVPIKNDEYVVSISVSRNHSLLLTSNSAVYACGVNDDKQLGLRDAGANVTVFKEVTTFRDYRVNDLNRVIACDHHSLAYSWQHIYVWGKNNGQMGEAETVKTQLVPKKIYLSADTRVICAESNNTATVVLSQDNIILLFHKYKLKKLKAPAFSLLKTVCLTGGDTPTTPKGTPTALKVLMLTTNNAVYMWYELSQTYLRCIFSPLWISPIDKILYNANQVLILSQGDVYKGKCVQVAVPHNSATGKQHRNENSTAIWTQCGQTGVEISNKHVVHIDLERLSTLDRADDIYCDYDFTSFAVLQESPTKYFKSATLQPVEYNFKKLFDNAHKEDNVHDIVFHVRGVASAAHKFIVYSRAPGLRALVGNCGDKNIHLHVRFLTSKIFELMLNYIYTNYLPNDDDLLEIHQSLRHDNIIEREEVCLIFLQLVNDFELHDLYGYLKSYLKQQPFCLPHKPDKSKYRFNRLHHKDLPDLYDVRIICEGDVELPGHKCVLVARLEYFEMMFSHNWAEQKIINLSTVSVEYMRPILEFLYSSDVDYFRKQAKSEMFLYNMIVLCDQFLIERLRKVCELLILDKITIKKCGDILDFACEYNCEMLQDGCADFICQNLNRVLMSRCLENCAPDALKCLNTHYKEMFSYVLDYRVITPDSEGVDDEFLQTFVKDFEIDLKHRMISEENTKTAVKAKSSTNIVKLTTRQCERDAILCMLEMQNVSEGSKKAEEAQNISDNGIRQTATNTLDESKNWIKNVKKKSHNVISSFVHTPIVALRSNGDPIDLPNSTKSGNVEVETKTTHSDKNQEPRSTQSTPSVRAYNLDLADIATPREKLSQKQRKQITNTTSPLASWREQVAKPVAKTVPQQNAWSVLPQSTSATVVFADPTGSTSEASRLKNETTANNNFSQILIDENKQRSHCERMRKKSLALIQIEELAITELEEFYNSHNVTDEIITIERKSRPTTTSFSSWRRE